MLDEILDHNDPVFRHLYEVYNLYNKNHTIKPYEIIEKNFLSYIFVGNLLYTLDKKVMLHDVYILESTKYDFYIKFLSVNFCRSAVKLYRGNRFRRGKFCDYSAIYSSNFFGKLTDVAEKS